MLSRLYGASFPAVLRLAEKAGAEAAGPAVLDFASRMAAQCGGNGVGDGDEAFLQAFLLICLQLELCRPKPPPRTMALGALPPPTPPAEAALRAAVVQQLMGQHGGGELGLERLLAEHGGGEGEGPAARAGRLAAAATEAGVEGFGGGRIRRWVDGGWGQWWPALLDWAAATWHAGVACGRPGLHSAAVSRARPRCLDERPAHAQNAESSTPNAPKNEHSSPTALVNTVANICLAINTAGWQLATAPTADARAPAAGQPRARCGHRDAAGGAGRDCDRAGGAAAWPARRVGHGTGAGVTMSGRLLHCSRLLELLDELNCMESRSMYPILQNQVRH